MIIKTTRFGDLKIEDNQVVTLPSGLYSFPELQRFALIEQGEGALRWLQSLDDPQIAFLLIDPTTSFKPDYQLTVAKEDLAAIGVEDIGGAKVWSILCVSASLPVKVTANLKAPLIMNKVSRQARQVILKGDTYTTREPVRSEETGLPLTFT